MINVPHSSWGNFWYSPRQESLYLSFVVSLTPYNHYCKIKGKTYLYSEWKDGHPLRNPSNWDDAIYLGWGYYSHSIKV